MFPEKLQNLINIIHTFPTIGIKTAEKISFDLLNKTPEELENIAKAITNIKDIILDEDNNILASVASVPKIMKRGNKIIVTFLIKDATGGIFVTFYNQPYMKNNFSLASNMSVRLHECILSTS